MQQVLKAVPEIAAELKPIIRGFNRFLTELNIETLKQMEEAGIEREYTKVEIARKQLPGMDDDDVFRAWLADHFYGKRSRKDLSDQELKLVDLMARLGARYTSKTSNKRREFVAIMAFSFAFEFRPIFFGLGR